MLKSKASCYTHMQPHNTDKMVGGDTKEDTSPGAALFYLLGLATGGPIIQVVINIKALDNMGGKGRLLDSGKL